MSPRHTVSTILLLSIACVAGQGCKNVKRPSEPGRPASQEVTPPPQAAGRPTTSGTPSTGPSPGDPPAPTRPAADVTPQRPDPATAPATQPLAETRPMTYASIPPTTRPLETEPLATTHPATGTTTPATYREAQTQPATAPTMPSTTQSTPATAPPTTGAAIGPSTQSTSGPSDPAGGLATSPPTTTTAPSTATAGLPPPAGGNPTPPTTLAATAPGDPSTSDGMAAVPEWNDTDGSPHPILAPATTGAERWPRKALIVTAGLFLLGAVVGPRVRSVAADEFPPTHSNDEPPGASHRHGVSGTLDPEPDLRRGRGRGH